MTEAVKSMTGRNSAEQGCFESSQYSASDHMKEFVPVRTYMYESGRIGLCTDTVL